MEVNLDEVERVIAAEAVPVISPLARDAAGGALNINADIAAGTVAGGLAAAKMIYLSDVPGLMRDHRDPTTASSRMYVPFQGLYARCALGGLFLWQRMVSPGRD